MPPETQGPHGLGGDVDFPDISGNDRIYRQRWPSKGSKQVINFPQNVSTLTSVLPQLSLDIPLIVRCSDIYETKHYDFRVHQHKIRDALQLLKNNNKWYRVITISDERLIQLPTYANLEEHFWRRIVMCPRDKAEWVMKWK
jgi:hypothetical protein